MEETSYSWPPEPAEYPAWMANFTAFVVTHATLLGFSPAEVTWLQARSTAASYAEKVLTELKKLWLEYVNLRNIQWAGDPLNPALPMADWITLLNPAVVPPAVPPNAKATLEGMVKRVATSNDITREQKRLAGVLSRKRKPVNPNNVTPILKVTVVNGQAVLDCPLRSFKGYTVYVEDGNGPAVSLGNSTSRKYTDSRPLPSGMQTQQRSYMVQYVGVRNENVGNLSVKITVPVMRII